MSGSSSKIGLIKITSLFETVQGLKNGTKAQNASKDLMNRFQPKNYIHTRCIS